VVGEYPFQAVAGDIEKVGNGYDAGFFCIALFSIPMDAAFDLLLSPFDLIFWPLGFSRRDAANWYQGGH
jgi:hypothetical protein